MKVLLIRTSQNAGASKRSRQSCGAPLHASACGSASVCLRAPGGPSAAQSEHGRRGEGGEEADFLVKHRPDASLLVERVATSNAREPRGRPSAPRRWRRGGVAASTDAAAEKKSQAEYVRGRLQVGVDMDEIRAEAARMDDGAPGRPALKHSTPTLTAVPEADRRRRWRARVKPMQRPNSGRSSAPRAGREKSVEQRGRFTVFENDLQARSPPEEEGKLTAKRDGVE